MRIAVISDVHGNAGALAVVLAEIGRAGVDLVVNCGDIVSGALDPRGTLGLLLPRPFPTVRGNHERNVLSGPPDQLGPSDALAHRQLSATQRDWLSSLPPRLEVAPGVLACHATPHDDATYLLETVEQGRLRPATAQEIETRLGADGDGRWQLMLCGHSHTARAVTSAEGTLILNPGSVGTPAYDSDWPTPHVMESGSAMARYAVAEQMAGGAWQAELRCTVYPWDAAADLADANGRPDAAYALRTGYAAPASSAR